MQVIGFDIGGANIKASDADGNSVSIPFPIWIRKEELPAVLKSVAASVCPEPDMVAVTMTAELADCFVTKAEGVEFVISAVETAFGGVPIRIWMTSSEFAEPRDARELPALVAAANWHALSTWAGRAVPEGPALLIDVGSTTTDVIPLLDGVPVSQGMNDSERLLCGELVYTGAFRTPVCAVVSAVPFRGKQCPVAAEVFATIADAALVTGNREEDPETSDTADGRPLTVPQALNRLARMVCCDRTEITDDELKRVAEHVLAQQRNQLCDAVQQVLAGLEKTMQQSEQRSLKVEAPVVLLSGSGAVIAQHVVDQLGRSQFANVMFLPQMFHKAIAGTACAFAVARLAHDRCRDDLLEVSEF